MECKKLQTNCMFCHILLEMFLQILTPICFFLYVFLINTKFYLNQVHYFLVV